MAFIEDLPKVSLHDHLDGGLRPETIIELAERDGLTLPTTDADELADWFVESCSGGDLDAYLQTFELTLSVMQTPEDLRRIATEFALDLEADGVIYAEVRYAPEQHRRRGLTLQAVVESVQTGFDSAMAEVAKRGGDLRVTQILCAMRNGDESMAVAELALKYRDTGVVGFDLAGPEAEYPPRLHRDALRLLAKHHFPTTIHAGEEGGLQSVDEAILGRALRLGHGTQLAEDFDVEEDGEGHLLVALGDTAQWVLDRELTLECCPSSNLQTGASPWGPDLADHPFDVMYQLGMRVTVNPDNRLMSDTTLSTELALLTEAFSYDLDDLFQFQLNAAMGAFLPLDERRALILKIEAGFEDFEDALAEETLTDGELADEG